MSVTQRSFTCDRCGFYVGHRAHRIRVDLSTGFHIDHILCAGCAIDLQEAIETTMGAIPAALVARRKALRP